MDGREAVSPSSDVRQPVHIWVSLSGVDELGSVPLEMGNVGSLHC